MSRSASLPIAPPGVASATEEARIVRKVAWHIMPLIMVCYLFAFFDRINVSFAKFALQTDLGLSDTAYGFGAGLFVVGYVLKEMPSLRPQLDTFIAEAYPHARARAADQTGLGLAAFPAELPYTSEQLLDPGYPAVMAQPCAQ